MSTKVKVHWSEEKVKKLPANGFYSTAARFREDAERWPEESWSINLRFDIASLQPDNTCDAIAQFLAPDAPTERLKKGCTFELFEGFKQTAIVTVL
jgi:hypothetical protein